MVWYLNIEEALYHTPWEGVKLTRLLAPYEQHCIYS